MSEFLQSPVILHAPHCLPGTDLMASLKVHIFVNVMEVRLEHPKGALQGGELPEICSTQGQRHHLLSEPQTILPINPTPLLVCEFSGRVQA